MTDGAPPAAGGGGDLVGSTLAGRYRIVRKLGEGAMGAVYLGEHLRMGRKDAIKVISRAMAGSAEAMARFEREARNASFINHPHVCQIYDFGETEEGLAFLAMEFVEGEPLGNILEREGGRLPADRAIRIVLQTAEALEAAHARNIVHRDLKPDNIMLTRGRDGADVVKVVDFGIAKGIGDDEGQAVTRLGFVIGTPEYMSPEQLSGDRLDGRSDVYSLALVLIRLLTGTFPFPAATAQELMLKRLTEAPRPLSELAPGSPFPPGLQGVLDRALARSAADRHPSASAFRQELEAALGSRIGAELGGGGVIPSTRVAPAGGGAPQGAAQQAAGVAGGTLQRRPPVAWIAGGVGVVALVVVILAFLVRGGGDDPSGPALPGPVAGSPGGETGGEVDPANPTGGTETPPEGTAGGAPGGSGPVTPPTGGGEVTPGPATPGGQVDPPPTAEGPRIAIVPSGAMDRLFGLTDRLDALYESTVGVSGDWDATRSYLASGDGRAGELRGAMEAARDTLEAIAQTSGVPDGVRAQAAFETANILRALPGASRDRIRALYEQATRLEPRSEYFQQALRDFSRGGG